MLEVIEVRHKESGDIIPIKALRFNPEVHELVGGNEPKKKPQEGDDLSSLKMSELRLLAEEKDIKLPFGVKKTDLIALLK